MKREFTRLVQVGKIVSNNNWLFVVCLSLQRGKHIKTKNKKVR